MDTPEKSETQIGTPVSKLKVEVFYSISISKFHALLVFSLFLCFCDGFFGVCSTFLH